MEWTGTTIWNDDELDELLIMNTSQQKKTPLINASQILTSKYNGLYKEVVFS